MRKKVKVGQYKFEIGEEISIPSYATVLSVYCETRDSLDGIFPCSAFLGTIRMKKKSQGYWELFPENDLLGFARHARFKRAASMKQGCTMLWAIRKMNQLRRIP